MKQLSKGITRRHKETPLPDCKSSQEMLRPPSLAQLVANPVVMDEHWHGNGNCSIDVVEWVKGLIYPEKTTRNGLTIVNVIFVGILVATAYMPHYRHRSTIRFFFLGASALFLPISSYVLSYASSRVSTFSQIQAYIVKVINDAGLFHNEVVWLRCDSDMYLILILSWVGLAQIIGINTSTIVAADDREGQNNGLPVELLVQAIWTLYLAIFGTNDVTDPLQLIFLILLMKVLLNCIAFWKAGRSLAHARNPRLIVGYMMQLDEQSMHAGPTAAQQVITAELVQEESQHSGSTFEIEAQHEQLLPQEIPHYSWITSFFTWVHILRAPAGRFQRSTSLHASPLTVLPPPLIVMGEERQKVKEQLQGYVMELMPSQDDVTLVRLDKVWQLEGTFMGSMPRFKDVCFSFALFKLMRCRFSGYDVAEAGFAKTQRFFRHEFLKDSDAERVFRVIEDELSFLHDYYYTSLPISYSDSMLLKVSIVITLLVIWICILFGGAFYVVIDELTKYDQRAKIMCVISCGDISDIDKHNTIVRIGGSVVFDIVLVCMFLALVALAEVRIIVSYMCSNWTKVTLICWYLVSHGTRGSTRCVKKLITSFLLSINCKFVQHWSQNMNQCLVLMLQQSYYPIVLFTGLRIRLGLPDRSKNVKIPTAVKVAIVNTLRGRSGGDFLAPSLPNHNIFRPDYNEKGTAHTILICHIATSLLEVRHPHPAPVSDDEITATHLSRYCAYLVAHTPELLPDDDQWCKSLYTAVKKDSSDIRASGADKYEKLHRLLIWSHHEVLRAGAILATKLLQEEDTAWSLLAGFWCEMVLHVASSSKLEHHREAIARGGELITPLDIANARRS